MAAVVRGPETVFLYWRTDGPRSAEAVRELGADHEWVLRVLDLSEGTSRSLVVDRVAANYYARVESGRVYGFELAVRAHGKWRTVCRTERVETPPATPLPKPDARPAHERPDRGTPALLDKLRAAARGIGVPGLAFETTAVHLGSSPTGRPKEQQ